MGYREWLLGIWKRADFAVENLKKYVEDKEVEGRIVKRL